MALLLLLLLINNVCICHVYTMPCDVAHLCVVCSSSYKLSLLCCVVLATCLSSVGLFEVIRSALGIASWKQQCSTQ